MKASPRLSNAQVMKRLPQMLGKIRLNTRTGAIHTLQKGVLNGNEASLHYLALSNENENWPKEATTDAIFLLAHMNRFDPVLQYLEQNTGQPLPMDQWLRLDQHLLGIDDPIARAFLPQFFIGAVARCLVPGCEMRQLPVLIGPQHKGKTELARKLFGMEWVVEGISKLDKDALLKAHTSWVVELAELDGVTRKADQESLKAFISERRDVFRAPYDRSPEPHLRRFVFWGTSNSPPFRDPTGSTRFVAIPISRERMLPLDWAEQNRNALWARALQQYEEGVEWRFPSEATRLAIAERNANYTEIDPWADRVMALLKSREAGPLPVRFDDLYTLLDIHAAQQNNVTANRLRSIAESNGWEYARKRFGGDQPRGFWPVPPVPGACQVEAAQETTCEGSSSGELCHPGHPPKEKQDREEIEGAPPSGPGLEGLPIAPGTGGTEGKAWQAVAMQLHREDSKKAAYTVALELHRMGHLNITGQDVAFLWEKCRV